MVLRKASGTTNAFVIAGLAVGSPLPVLGVLALFYCEWPTKVAEAIVGAATAGLVSL